MGGSCEAEEPVKVGSLSEGKFRVSDMIQEYSVPRGNGKIRIQEDGDVTMWLDAEQRS
jgi:hypothetical protein